MNAPLSIKNVLLTASLLGVAACPQELPQTLITLADARTDPAQFIDIGEPGDSAGDILIFDQPLLDEDREIIGNNSGRCIRTRLGHSFQCQWTLTFENGTIQVAGREFDEGTSEISITGGTGSYSGITGEMTSVNNNDGTFTQTLRSIRATLENQAYVSLSHQLQAAIAPAGRRCRRSTGRADRPGPGGHPVCGPARLQACAPHERRVRHQAPVVPAS